MTTTETTLEKLSTESADREKIKKEIMQALLSEERIFIGEAFRTASIGGFISYEPKDRKYFKAKRIIRPLTPEEDELYKYYHKRWEEIQDEQLRIEDELPDDASDWKTAKAEKKLNKLDKEEQETIDGQEEINAKKRIIVEKEEITEEDAMKFIDEVISLTVEFRKPTIFPNKEAVISTIKKELKAGKRIPVDVPFEQQIIDSFDPQFNYFEDRFIEAKNYNPDFFENYLYMDMNKRELIFHVKRSMLPKFTGIIPEAVEYDQDYIKDIQDSNAVDKETHIGELFDAFCELSKNFSFREFDIPISTNSAQILLDRIAMLTMGDSEVDKWLDN